ADWWQCGQFRVAGFFSGRSSKNSRSSITRSSLFREYFTELRCGPGLSYRNSAPETKIQIVQGGDGGEGSGTREDWRATAGASSSRPQEEESGRETQAYARAATRKRMRVQQTCGKSGACSTLLTPSS